MQEFAELIKAIANLLWPIIFITIVFIFKNEFSEVLRRFKRGKLLGQELELEKSLDSLELKAKVINSEFPLIEAIPGGDKDEIGQSQIIKKILEMTSKDLKAALLFLDSEIEKELRKFMLISGHHNRIKNVSLGTIATYLGEIGYLTDAMVSTIHSFREIKNKIIHGSQEGTDYIHRVIDTGLTILKTLLGDL
ncbi:MAG: hypothetical protein MRJ67_08685 [Nitrospirales bacterium]|nr:hypothetical protein [Nitrospirales bacterium]